MHHRLRIARSARPLQLGVMSVGSIGAGWECSVATPGVLIAAAVA
jgi:hypothetical protein